MSETPTPDERLQRSGWLARARHEAALWLRDPEKLKDLLAKAAGRGVVGEAAETLRAFIRLVQAWAGGRYREVGTDTILLVVAALIYVVWPVDLIADVLPVIGLTDDAAMLFVVARKLRDELAKFRRWEAEQASPPPDEAP